MDRSASIDGRTKGVGNLFKIERRGQPRYILHEDSRPLFNPDATTPTTVLATYWFIPELFRQPQGKLHGSFDGGQLFR